MREEDPRAYSACAGGFQSGPRHPSGRDRWEARRGSPELTNGRWSNWPHQDERRHQPKLELQRLLDPNDWKGDLAGGRRKNGAQKELDMTMNVMDA